MLSPGGAGTVRYAGWAPSGWESCGQYIVVDHGGGWWSVVCHLSAVYVRTGQTVTNNTIIGLVGSTGTSEAHLHFSLVKNASITAAGGVYGGAERSSPAPLPPGLRRRLLRLDLPGHAGLLLTSAFIRRIHPAHPAGLRFGARPRPRTELPTAPSRSVK
ncbi:M23 family metallopeptidase [Microbispora hainanensis]|uniref:M23 family metallopeptidase n=1 Tax=Microbispora hainanensis TaxID=568844 RepID=UPI002E2DD652|nr:M23 family metallopeptidase [Microbispora hainanensis]